MEFTIYLSGEIHSDWRDQIIDGIEQHNLPVTVLGPVTDHAASDNVGVDILGDEDDNFWQDHKAARINSIRIRTGIERADIVVVKFGERVLYLHLDDRLVVRVQLHEDLAREGGLVRQ